MIEPGAIAAVVTGLAAILVRRRYASLVAQIWASRLRFKLTDSEAVVRSSMWVVGAFFIAGGVAWQLAAL